MIAVIDRPQTILTINDDTKDRVEQSVLRLHIRKRHNRTIDVLQQLVALRSGLRVHREENATFRADRDVAYRFRVRENFLKRAFRQEWRFCKVRVKLTTAVTGPEYDNQDETQN